MRNPHATTVAASALLLVAMSRPAAAQSVTTLDDITTWIGSGTSRAALVLDFDDTSALAPARVWGYRFNGTPTAESMFRDIVTMDPNLYAKIVNFSFGDAINGLGYDADGDGFALSDATAFGLGGIVELSPSAASEGATAVDVDDFYRESFFVSGFWHLALAATSPYDGGVWTSAPVGMSDQVLADGMFIGFTFDGDFSSFDGTPFDFPENPQNIGAEAAAVPEPAAAWGMAMAALLTLLLGRRFGRRLD